MQNFMCSDLVHFLLGGANFKSRLTTVPSELLVLAADQKPVRAAVSGPVFQRSQLSELGRSALDLPLEASAR